MFIRNSFLNHFNLKLQKKSLFILNLFKPPKIFREKNTNLILHPELAFKMDEEKKINSIESNPKLINEQFQRENFKNLVFDENLDFLKLDSKGNPKDKFQKTFQYFFIKYF